MEHDRTSKLTAWHATGHRPEGLPHSQNQAVLCVHWHAWSCERCSSRGERVQPTQHATGHRATQPKSSWSVWPMSTDPEPRRNRTSDRSARHTAKIKRFCVFAGVQMSAPNKTTRVDVGM